MIQDNLTIPSLKTEALTVQLIDSVEGFQSLQKDWDALYDNCERNSIFCSWDWMFTWWEVFQDQYDRELFILGVYQDTRLVGIAPFQISTVPFPKSLIQGKTLLFIGNGEAFDDAIISMYQDLIVLPEFESKMIRVISDYLIEYSNKWNFSDFEFLLNDALILKCFDRASNHAKDIACYKMQYGVRFSIPKMEDFESYKAQMGGRWRKMLIKRGNKLSRNGEVTTVGIESLDCIKPALAKLVKLSRSRWENKNEQCVFNSTRFIEFHEKVMMRLVPKKKADIKILQLDGEALASYYTFMDKGVIHYYQSGFDSKFGNRYSPLFLLICNEIGEAIENNKIFDFMFSEEKNSYKKEQYSCQYEPMYRLRWTTQKYRLPLFHSAIRLKLTMISMKKIFNKMLHK